MGGEATLNIWRDEREPSGLARGLPEGTHDLAESSHAGLESAGARWLNVCGFWRNGKPLVTRGPSAVPISVRGN
jgi:hypothetical protein